MWDRYPSLGIIITFDKRGALVVKSHQGLAEIVSHVTKKHELKCVKLEQKEVVVNMLQFIDDIMFMCDTKIQNLLMIK